MFLLPIKKKFNGLCVVAMVMMGSLTFSSVALAGDKNLFNDRPTEQKCRNCHDNPELFPMTNISNPDRHHLLVGKRIAYPSVAPNDSAQGVYECLTCHTLSTDPSNNFVIEPFRDCFKCHPVKTVTESPGSQNVHHLTDFIDTHNSCKFCHDVYRSLFPPGKKYTARRLVIYFTWGGITLPRSFSLRSPFFRCSLRKKHSKA